MEIKKPSRYKRDGFSSNLVRMEGLEPPYLAASDPKSDVSTNFTTSGRKVRSQTNHISQFIDLTFTTHSTLYDYQNGLQM